MSNYDFKLDLETDNSNSLILRQIKPNSSILEFGPAHGRMTKFLKENLNCNVTIVEIDEEAGQEASKYATFSILGPEAGDIEKFYWAEMENTFDYIIFADVLEHLRDPLSVLEATYPLLKDTGSILISIPNIGHNAVLIDLWNGKWNYRGTGILDDTHLKFFTRSSLKTMVESAGFAIKNEFNAINRVSATEFDNSYNDVPEEVAKLLKEREHGETYQFIWELKKKKIEISIILLCFNKWNFTKSCLEDLSKLPSDKFEIIVVNNGSSDETYDELEKFRRRLSNLKILHMRENMGFAKGCNRGYEAAEGDYVMFINNDIRVKSNDDWVSRVLPECAPMTIIGPTGGMVDPTSFRFLYETNDANKQINYLVGWLLLSKRETWDALMLPTNTFKGPFDESFFVYYDDTDLSFRCKDRGIQLKIVPVPVFHFGKVSSKQLNTNALYLQAKEVFLRKWGVSDTIK